MANDPIRDQDKPKLTSSEIDSDVELYSEQGDTSFPLINDKYEIVEFLGKGGMGTVYKVKDTNSQQLFAVKILHTELTQDRASLKRFEQEIEALSQLNHPNLLAIYDHGTTESGAPFFIMDYIDGKTMGELIKQEPDYTSLEFIDIFLGVCAGLKEAHSKGIIHRDLKPSNIIASKNEAEKTFKIADFGIASIANNSVNYTQTLTETSDVIGSPKYMSPEQCTGKPMNESSDIYSLGCVMYEFITKKPVFDGGNAIQIILKQLNDTPETLPKQLKNKDPRYHQIDHLIQNCLIKPQRSRYSSVDLVIQDLNKIKHGGKISNTLHKEIKLAITALISCILIVISIAFLVAAFNRSNEAPPPLNISQTSVTQKPNDRSPQPDADNLPSFAWSSRSEDQIAREMQMVAFKHFKNRDYKQAIPALKYVAETHKKAGKIWYESFSYQCIGQCYLSLGKYKEAEPWYEKAVAGMSKYLKGDISKINGETISGYVEVLNKLGKHDQAKKWLLVVPAKSLEQYVKFYTRENLPEDAARVKRQLEERLTL